MTKGMHRKMKEKKNERDRNEGRNRQAQTQKDLNRVVVNSRIELDLR